MGGALYRISQPFRNHYLIVALLKGFNSGSEISYGKLVFVWLRIRNLTTLFLPLGVLRAYQGIKNSRQQHCIVKETLT